MNALEVRIGGKTGRATDKSNARKLGLVNLPGHQSNHSEDKKFWNPSSALFRYKGGAMEEKQLLLINQIKVQVNELIAHRFWRQAEI